MLKLAPELVETLVKALKKNEAGTYDLEFDSIEVSKKEVNLYHKGKKLMYMNLPYTYHPARDTLTIDFSGGGRLYNVLSC